MSRKNTKGTILAIDMGNTNIVIGCVDDDKVIFEERLSTDLSKTELEYATNRRYRLWYRQTCYVAYRFTCD